MDDRWKTLSVWNSEGTGYVPEKFNAATGVKFFLYIGDWSNGMIGVSKTFGGGSIPSSPVYKQLDNLEKSGVSAVFIFAGIRKGLT